MLQSEHIQTKNIYFTCRGEISKVPEIENRDDENENLFFLN